MISKLVTVVFLFNQQNILQDVLDYFKSALDKSHYDIIVVNDALTDKTKEILELYSDT